MKRAVGTAYRKEMSTPTLDRVLRWVVVHPYVDEAPPVEAPLSAAEWGELLDLVANQRVAGQLAAALTAGLPATGDQAAQAAAAHREAMMFDLKAEAALVALGAAFDAGGVEWLVIKGLAAARLLYADAGMRSTGDVDVLVRPESYHRALELARAAGLAAWEYPPHGPYHERVERGRTLVTPDDVELDIHRRIQGRLPRWGIPVEAMFESAGVVSVQGVAMRAPSPSMVLLHAMLHLATGRPGPRSLARLSTLGDLVVGRGRHVAEYGEALAAAERFGCATPAAWADGVVRSWVEGVEVGAGGLSHLWLFDRMLRVPGLYEVTSRLTGPHRLHRSLEALFPSQEFRRVNERSGTEQARYVWGRVSGQQ